MVVRRGLKYISKFMKSILYIIEASKLVLGEIKYLVFFLVFWGILFVIMFSIPLYSIPGNDLKLQMTIFTPRDYVLLGLLSFLSSLVVTMQVNIFRKKLPSPRSNAALGGAGVFSGVFSSIFASATCAMCIGSLFSFLGFGGVFFLVENRWYILSGAIMLLLVSLYFASRRFVEGCQSCIIQESV